MRWTVLMLMAATACASSGGSSIDVPIEAANDPTVPTTPTAPTAPSRSTTPGVQPDGFEVMAALVTEADGTTCEVCVWLADTADRRSRGLMFVTDLGDAVAMAFEYPDPHSGTFWMKNTVLPLSIAFYSPDGEYMDAFDMPPCTADPCPNYRTPDDFLIAIETPQGGLDALGLTVGSTFELLGLPCGG